ncbi:glycosyl hydrolase family 28 protein [Crateriforma spongiae]|uniref:glycosyl hydrolase family 28 protein n=1 Tax=Crateriforma spongiae TaxID=2724528 RepID=UPI001446BEC4|nr:glycosyl hydrolase family 28 protein [Crateriforma spongiae]
MDDAMVPLYNQRTTATKPVAREKIDSPNLQYQMTQECPIRVALRSSRQVLGLVAIVVLCVAAGQRVVAQRPETLQDASTSSVNQDKPWAVFRTPGLGDSQRSPFYRVEVQGQPADVYVTRPPAGDGRTDGAAFDRADRRSFSFATFQCGKAVDVKVQKLNGAFQQVRLRPSRKIGVDFDILQQDAQAGWVKIRVHKPGVKVSVEFIDQHFRQRRDLPRDALLLFADPMAEQHEQFLGGPAIDDDDIGYVTPGAKLASVQSKPVIVFPPGIHRIGDWKVPEGVQRIHLQGGAYVMGAIDARSVDGLMMTGSGILSGEDFPWRSQHGSDEPVMHDPWKTSIKLVDVGPDFKIQGVTLANAPHFVCNTFDHGGTIRNVKILGSWRWNNDGFDVPRNGIVEDCFVSAFDDAFKLYHDHAVVRNCVVWQMNNGAVFQLGWFGKNVSDVRVSHIDVIHTEYTGTNENWGLVSMARHDGAGVIEDFVFEDIVMEGPVARLIGLHLHESPKQKIRDMRFRDISVDRWLDPSDYNNIAETGNVPSQADPSGVTNVVGGDVQGLAFERLRVAGEFISQQNFQTTGRFTVIGSPEVSFPSDASSGDHPKSESRDARQD